jgi:ankyrin repeat protein
VIVTPAAWQKTSLCHTLIADGSISLLENKLRRGLIHANDVQLGRPALHTAILSGQLEATSLLIKYGANVEAVDELGLSPLALAASCNATGALQRLIEEGHANVLQQVTEKQWSAATFALWHGHLPAFSLLLTKGGPDLCLLLGEEGYSLAHFAVLLQQEEALQAIVAAGGKTDGEGGANGNETPLFLSVAQGWWPGLRLLLTEANPALAEWKNVVNGESALHLAVAAGDVERVKLCLASGCGVQSVRDSDGVQPLHLAAKAGSLPIVECLLEAGASVGETDSEGNTAYALAEAAGHQALLDKFGPPPKAAGKKK